LLVGGVLEGVSEGAADVYVVVDQVDVEEEEPLVDTRRDLGHVRR
jgi:hypothetical protein